MPNGFVQVYGMITGGNISAGGALSSLHPPNSDHARLYGSMNEIFCMSDGRKSYIRKDGMFNGEKIYPSDKLLSHRILVEIDKEIGYSPFLRSFELSHLMSDYSIHIGDITAAERGNPTAQEVASHIGKKLPSRNSLAHLTDTHGNHVVVMNIEEPENIPKVVNTFNAYRMIEIKWQ